MVEITVNIIIITTEVDYAFLANLPLKNYARYQIKHAKNNDII